MPLDGTDFSSSLVTQAFVVARDRLEKGWCPRGGRSREGVCLAIALSDAAVEVGIDFSDVYSILNQILCLRGPEGISTWNDSHSREDILDACNQSINISMDIHALAVIA